LSPGWQQPLVYYRLRDLAEKTVAQISTPGVRAAAEKVLGSVRRRIQDTEEAVEF
jgi:hypothetical protein